MKYFQKIISYIIVFIICFVFIQSDLFTQTDRLENNDSLIIGGVYKVILKGDKEILGKMKSSDSISISLLSYNDIVIIDRSDIEFVKKLKYLLQFETEKEVTVTTNSDASYKGDLLSLTEDNLSLTRNEDFDYQSSIRLKNNVRDIERKEIKRILIYGKSNVASGAFAGATLGIIMGVMIGGSQDKNMFFSSSQMAGIGGLVGVILGGVLGLGIGVASSTPDEIIEIYSDDLYRLNKYSMFSFGELPTYQKNKK